MDKRKITQIVISILFTALLLAIIFCLVPLPELIGSLRLVNYKFIIIGFFFHMITYLVRTLMLYSLLRKGEITFKYLMAIHFIQNFFVHLVPASLGEFSFPILLKKKIEMSRSLSALLITKFILMAGLVLLFFISLVALFNEKIDFGTNFTTILIFLLTVIFSLVLLKSYRGNLKNLFLRKISDALFRLKLSVTDDLKKFKNAKFSLLFIFLTLLSNFSLAYFYITILAGMNVHLDFWQSIFISSIGIAFLILPIKSLGGFGTSEGSWAIGMVLLGFDKTIGIQTGFVAHVFALLNVFFLLLIGIAIILFDNKKRKLQINTLS